MSTVHFQGKIFNTKVIQVYAPTTKAEEAEGEWFCEDLQGLLELKARKDVLFITGIRMQNQEVKRHLEKQGSLASENKMKNKG